MRGTNHFILQARARLLDNEIKIMRSDIMRIQHELQTQKDKIKENTEKIKVSFLYPFKSFKISKLQE